MVQQTLPLLRLSPECSNILSTFILCSHFVAMVVVFLLPFELWLQLIILFVVAVSMVQSMRIYVWRSCGSAIKSAEWNHEGEWKLLTANGDELSAQLKTSSYVQPWFVILNFSIGHLQQRSLILLPDTIDPELLRQLRVRLRFANKIQEASSHKGRP